MSTVEETKKMFVCVCHGWQFLYGQLSRDSCVLPVSPSCTGGPNQDGCDKEGGRSTAIALVGGRDVRLVSAGFSRWSPVELVATPRPDVLTSGHRTDAGSGMGYNGRSDASFVFKDLIFFGLSLELFYFYYSNHSNCVAILGTYLLSF